MSSFLDEIDFCIKTYKRPKALARLIASIRQFYRQAHITTNALPCLAKGRNTLAKFTSRPFMLLLDDDFLFTEETKIEFLWEQMADASIGVAGGVVMDLLPERVQRNSGGTMYIKDRDLHLVSRLRGEMASKWTDVTPNFCLIRRRVFEKCQWRFGIGAEHADFFLQVREAGWRVCQVDACKIDHDTKAPADPDYKQARWGDKMATNILRMMAHWDIDRIIVNGTVRHARPLDCLLENAR